MKRKILFIIAMLMVVSTIARTLIVSYSFLDFTKTSIENETSLIRDILLESSDIDKTRQLIAKSYAVKNVEILSGRHNANIKFDMNNKLITSFKPFTKNSYLKLTFEGSSILKQEYFMFGQIILIGLISLILIILITNYFLTPYLEITEKIKDSINYAKKGNFKHKVETNLKGDAAQLVEWYNTLLDKLQNTFGVIEEKYKILIDKKSDTNDLLVDAKNTMEELASIYQFKQIIENDINVDNIYNRLIDIMKNKFQFQNFSIYEINNKTNEISKSFVEGEVCCNLSADPEVCRVYRTSQRINSVKTPKICTERNCNSEYYCFPYATTGNFTGMVTINLKNSEEYLEKRDYIAFIRSYFKEASSIIDSKHNLEILKTSSLTDQLTGLYNRRYLDEMLTKIVPSTIREKSILGIFMIDIDYFKKVNDEFGHDAGDAVLKTLSGVLINSVRESDLVIRYGGEEFVIILQNIKDKEYIIKVAEKIRKAFENTKINVNGKTIRKTLSIGVSYYQNESQKIWECIKYADLALYEAKNTGRNKVIEFTEELATKSGYNN